MRSARLGSAECLVVGKITVLVLNVVVDSIDNGNFHTLALGDIVFITGGDLVVDLYGNGAHILITCHIVRLGDVGDGIIDYRVKKHNEGKLDKEGKTAREGVVAFLLLQLHNFLLLLLHCALVGSSFILGLDELNLGSELGHCDLVFLLFDREW